MKSSEQLELERIKQLKKRAAMQRQLAEHSLQLAKSSVPYHPVKSSTKATLPTEFSFATDSRIKQQEVKADRSKGFIESLRHGEEAKVSVMLDCISLLTCI